MWEQGVWGMGNSDGFIPWQIFLAISFHTLQPWGIWQLSYSKPLEVLLEQKKLRQFLFFATPTTVCILIYSWFWSRESPSFKLSPQNAFFFSGILKMLHANSMMIPIHELVLIHVFLFIHTLTSEPIQHFCRLLPVSARSPRQSCSLGFGHP